MSRFDTRTGKPPAVIDKYTGYLLTYDADNPSKTRLDPPRFTCIYSDYSILSGSGPRHCDDDLAGSSQF